MTMKLRDNAIEWKSPDGNITLWFHPGSAFGKLTIVLSQINRIFPPDEAAEETGNYLISNLRVAFQYLEAYVVDYEYTGDEQSSIVEYLKHRTTLNLSYNLELFLNLLSYTDIEFIFEAFNSTRLEKDDDPSKDAET